MRRVIGVIVILMGAFAFAFAGSLTGNAVNGAPQLAGSAGVAGPAGPAGSSGPAGPPGMPGPAGQDGATGAQGLTGPEGAAGPQGDKGDKGSDGVDGKAGAPGSDGVDGKDGTNGKNGTNGTNGKDGTATFRMVTAAGVSAFVKMRDVTSMASIDLMASGGDTPYVNCYSAGSGDFHIDSVALIAMLVTE